MSEYGRRWEAMREAQRPREEARKQLRAVLDQFADELASVRDLDPADRRECQRILDEVEELREKLAGPLYTPENWPLEE